jgi:O-antigen/teichoic acid export membrane protein
MQESVPTTVKNRVISWIKTPGFQKYFKSTGWLFSAKIISLVLSFFVVAMVARYLGPTNYGTLSYAISFVGIFSFLANIGIDSVLQRDLVKYPNRESELLGTSITMRILASIIATTIVIATTFISGEEVINRNIIIIIAISFIFQSFSLVNYSFLTRVESKYTSIGTIAVAIILSILKIAIILTGKGLYYFAAIYTLEPILYAVVFIYFFKRFYGSPFKWRFDMSLAKEMLREALPLMVANVFILIYSRIDQVMLKHFIDVKAVGLYDAAVRLSELWYFIPSIIVTSLAPAIINAKDNEDKTMYAKRLLRLTFFLVIFSTVVALVVSLFAKLIMGIIFGQAFITGYTALQLYVWSGVGISVGLILNQFLVTEKMTYAVLYISIIGMALNVTLNLVLIPRYGINGSALATLISYIVGPLSVLTLPKARKSLILLFN